MKLNSLSSNANVIYWRLDVDSEKLERLIGPIEKIYGISKSYFYQNPRKAWMEAVHESDKEVAKQASELLQINDRVNTEYRILNKKSGKVIYVNDTKLAEKIGEKHIIHGFLRPISDEPELLDLVSKRTKLEKLEDDIINTLNKKQNSEGKLINEVLERLGNINPVHRVYIFESYVKNGETFVNQTFEWTGKGILPQIDNPDLQDVPFSEGFTRWYESFKRDEPITGYIENFPADERPILEEQDIVSLLAVPIKYSSQLLGFVGFDNCEKKIEWDTGIVNLLTRIAKFLGLLIQKNITKKKSELLAHSFFETQEFSDWQIFVYDKKYDQLELSKSKFQHFDQTIIPKILNGNTDIKANGKIYKSKKLPNDKSSKQTFEITDTLAQESFFLRANPNKDETFYTGLIESLDQIKESNATYVSRLNELIEYDGLKDKLIEMVSHEFKTPLTTITSTADLISHRSRDSEKNQKRAERILRASKNMNDLIEDILQMKKIKDDEIVWEEELVNLDQLVKSIDGNYSNNQQITWNIKGDNLFKSDYKNLEIIISNIVSNAVKYSSQDINVLISNNKDKFLLKCEDKGIGINQDDINRIFESFYRGSNVESRQGTGIGLHLVKQLLDSINGKIDITSSKNEGTTVRIVIPKS